VSTFQLAGITLTAVFACLSLVARLRGRIGARSGVAWVILWCSAGAAIAFPESTVVVARFLGISRGADLVFYCAILGMLMGFFAIYVKLRRIERNITTLVREVALAQAPPAPAGESLPAARSDVEA